jgi:hypothetical protein
LHSFYNVCLHSFVQNRCDFRTLKQSYSAAMQCIS